MAEIVMPRLSDSMEEGTVLRWLKSVGDEVAVGDELVEIETDKANMVYESDLAGTIVEVLAQEGDTLPVGDPIARVGDAEEVRSNGGGATGAASQTGRAGDESASQSSRPQISRPSNSRSLFQRPPPATPPGAPLPPLSLLPQPVLGATDA